ncbi:vWA domain-containing protein [Corynebacterium doosanense]|uniref:VWFA domain-containing protein n=1 Tax=Corynebacterium doosanense CAU 212 = DSM 45436 TaxID=558173 RepID=A0A097IJA9_9CORY|nr:vWA domain-containing protein [Corynebacterium doosanense]AIT62205.1 hypothetical protein CDOO_02710 [Corynebacterium doosanense CAU 212 = DSM 45436]
MTFTRQPGKKLFAAVGALLVLGTGSAFGVPQAQAQLPAPPPSENNALNDFAGCMAGEKTADVLLVLDQSGSLKESDPDGLRVGAAQDFVGELARYGENAGVDIRVRTAGFGTSYYGDEAGYGSWQSLADGAAGVNAELEKFRGRTDDEYTEYPDALRGSLATMQTNDSPCKAVMLFSDGEMTMESGDIEGAAAQLCSASGEVAQLRAAGVQIFTIGLDARGDQDMSRLKGIADSPDCGAPAPPNGQFFLGNSPASLLAAFRSAVPNPGGTGQNNISVRDAFPFFLDNSVTPVSLSAQPEDTVEGLTPLLTPPGGEPVDVVSGEQTIGGARVNATFNETVPGAVDIEMERAEEWAGEWRFGYRAETNPDASYRAQLSIRPGMNIHVDSGAGEQEGALRAINTQPLRVSLVDQAGVPVTLDGQATLSAFYRTPAGEIPLGENIPVGHGEPVDLDLSQVTEPTSGTLLALVNITTAGPEGAPGTPLNPVVYERGLSVTLENLPQPPNAINLGAISEEAVSVDAPAEGPGLLWIESGTWEGANLPEGTTATVSSPADSQENAIVLQRGETGSLPLEFTLSDLADGPISGELTVHFAELDGSNPSSTTVPVTGAMSAPVDVATFTAALVAVLLLALAIPLGILYLMKYLSGRIPISPKVAGVRVPVGLQGTSLVNKSTDKEFTLSREDLVQYGTAAMNPRRMNVAGHEIRVKHGINPFAPSAVIVENPVSVAGSGNQSGTKAKLPLAIQNQWFVTMNPQNAEDVTIVAMPDVMSQSARLDEMVADIRRYAPERISQLQSQLQSQRGEVGGEGAESVAPAPAAATPTDSPFGAPAGDSPFGGPDAGNSPFGGTGGNSPFGGPR